MALIQCVYCNKQISDKAKMCPHCRHKIEDTKEVGIFCEDCGTELDAECTSCPVCGCPVPSNVDVPQKVEVTSFALPKMKKNIKKVTLLIVLPIIVATVVLSVGKHIQNQKAEEAAANQKAEYAANLDTVSFLMLQGASEAETAGNLIQSVWHDAIYKEQNAATYKYVRPDRSEPYVDFNTALINLFSDPDFTDTIKSIESNQESVSALMKELKNPTDEYRDAYDALKNYYNAYTVLVNLVTSPSGSLQSFTQDFHDADTKLINSFETMQVYLED